MKRHLAIIAGTVVALLVVASGAWAMWTGGEPPAQKSTVATEKAATADRRLVTLTVAKREAAGIQVAAIAKRSFLHIHALPGRVQYDETRHVEIKAASDGVLQQCVVKPGDRVVQGQELAVLSSPEIGSATPKISPPVTPRPR